MPHVNVVVEDGPANDISSHHTNVIGNAEDVEVMQVDSRSLHNVNAFNDMTIATANRPQTPPMQSMKFRAHQVRQRNSRAMG